MFDHTDPTLRPSYYEIAQRAHYERRLLMQSYLRSAARSIARSFHLITMGFVRLVRHLVDEQRVRSDIRALQKLDDRTLADIGVRRDGIEYIVRNGRLVPYKSQFAVAHPRRKARLVMVTENVGTRISPVKVAPVTISSTATISRR